MAYDIPELPGRTLIDPAKLSTLAALVQPVVALLHGGESRIRACNHFLQATGARPVENEVDADHGLLALVRKLLDRDRYDLAAQLLWPPSMFSPDPRSVKLIWNEMLTNPLVLLMGASSMGKSYTPGVLMMLEWLRDPEWTSVRCVGPTEDHLRTNLFSHLVTLHGESAIPLPGVARDLFVGLDPKRREGCIMGVVIPQGMARARGRLQGSKRKPRPFKHPQFGYLSRLFLLFDELENVPPAIYPDIENVVSNINEGTDGGFRMIASWNPKDRSMKPYEMAEPIRGWDKFDLEKDEVWDSKRGFRVVRLDAAKCENVVEGVTRFPGLQTKAGFDMATKVSGGVGSPGWYTFCRGAYPPGTQARTLMSPEQLNMRKATPIWDRSPVFAGGCDLALAGGAGAPLVRGQFGNATGVRFPDGSLQLFKSPGGETVRRPVIYVDQLEYAASGDTLVVGPSVKSIAEANRIAPAWLELDRTGHGAGVHDLLRALWSPDIGGTNYSESATEKKVLEEDAGTARDLYTYVVSELWFAVQKLVVHGFLWFNPAGFKSMDVMFQQLSSRRYDPGKKDKVESKSDYKSRGFPSPDEADALTLMVHAVRRASGVVFSFSNSDAGAVSAGVFSAAGGRDTEIGEQHDAGAVPDFLDD